MEKTFEEKLQELEKINQNLSQGDLPLEKALKEFEAGIVLSKDCQKTLEAADKRVRILTEKDGNWEEKDYTENLSTQNPSGTNKQTGSSLQEKQPTEIREKQDSAPENLESSGNKDTNTDSFPF